MNQLGIRTREACTADLHRSRKDAEADGREETEEEKREAGRVQVKRW